MTDTRPSRTREAQAAYRRAYRAAGHDRHEIKRAQERVTERAQRQIVAMIDVSKRPLMSWDDQDRLYAGRSYG